MILITGANGQLGKDFQRIFNKLGISYLATHHSSVNHCEALDITDMETVKRFCNDREFEMIINCAAYNNVDRAEEEVEKAKLLNQVAVENLARISHNKNAIFVTYSTDFVFDGSKSSSYTEEDIPNPLSKYGESKLLGERAVLETIEKAFVIRTSWVFGIGNHNFNKSVLNWSRSRNEIKVVDDQVSVPTYSKDLAEYSWELIKSRKYGLYHLSNSGEASKFDQAHYLLNKMGWQGRLERAKTEDFPLPAKRAKYSKLDSSKAENVIGMKMPHWQDAIDRFLLEMKEAGEMI